MSVIKKIYEEDQWLKPYKEAIDARHERILEEKAICITACTVSRTGRGCSANGRRMR